MIQDTQELLQKIERLTEQLAVKDQQLDDKDQQLERKNERILYLERQMFGRRSEKKIPSYPDAQLSLFDADLGVPVLEQEAKLSSLVEDIKLKADKRHTAPIERTASTKRSYRLPENIERRETIINPDGFDAATMIKIGEDVSERLMQDPSKFWVERIVRPIYKVKENIEVISTTILQAPAKEGILPGCIAGHSLLSQIIVDKFLYYIPEYRQIKRFKEFGIDISTSSINRWVHALADKLYPLYAAQMQRILSTDYIQVDETTLSITDRSGSARKGYIWAVRSVRTPGVFFHYDKGSRSQEVILKLLKNYQGAIQTDGYAAYSIYEDKKGVLLLGCIAHVRRKFEYALREYKLNDIELKSVN